MDTITKEISDVVCTAITLGHIKKFNEKGDMQIVYEKHENAENEKKNKEDLKKKTSDQKELKKLEDEIAALEQEIENEKQHRDIEAKLKEIGCNITLNKVDPDKRDILLITGSSNSISCDNLVEYNKELSHQLSFINQKVNEYKKATTTAQGKEQKLYGAYIGGIYNADNSILRLLGPSKIITKKCIFNLDSTILNSLNSEYSTYRELSSFIMNSLKDAKNEAMIAIKSKYGNKIIIDYDYFKEKTLIPNNAVLNDGEIFGSVHGLINAILYYRLDANSRDVACEFAFSNDTTKVGSCVPCSIFASSNKTPANFTHFGRGDYWNLPQSSKEYNGLDMKRKAWEKYVRECFQIGIDIVNTMADKHNENIKTAINTINTICNVNTDKMPEIFLHSLMYAGSFLGKMDRIIKI